MLSAWVWEAAQGEAISQGLLGKKAERGKRNVGGVGSVLEVKATGKELQERKVSLVGSHDGR